MTPQPGDRYEHVPTGERYTYERRWFGYARLIRDGAPQGESRAVLMTDLLEGKQWRRESSEKGEQQAANADR